MSLFELHLGDCLEVMRGMADNSVDAVVTDPPYGLSFMGKHWDHGVPGEAFWREALRVAKPGAHLLAFGGTRTYHRLACAIEDAGWEIRDCVMWIYGSGFPKSADVSKMLDKHEQKQWIDVGKAIDNMPHSEIIEAWKKHLNTVINAGLSFAKSKIETGTNTPKSGFAPASVVLKANPESSDAVAVVAELSLIEARRTKGANCNSAQLLAEKSTTELRSHATSVASPHASLAATLDMPDSSALQSAWGWQGESTSDKLKAVEALKTWLGSKPSSRPEATVALCAALTADLKRITLNQSKTFLSFDTTRQTVCASAISATIMESTAESLISFTVDTLKSKAIDKAAGAERERIGDYGQGFRAKGSGLEGWQREAHSVDKGITAPATDAARQWQGWGTALKPAWEPIIVARKPLVGTVAENVLKHGTGAINVDGCRVASSDQIAAVTGKATLCGTRDGYDRPWKHDPAALAARQERANAAIEKANTQGRWPANLIHDGSDEVLAGFPVTGASKAAPRGGTNPNPMDWGNGRSDGGVVKGHTDTGGSAARFFYCAKASKRDRDEGCEGLEEGIYTLKNDCPEHIKKEEDGVRVHNSHPT